jgi:hypothetical protein
MFARILRHNGNFIEKEFYVNLEHISMIEVSYIVPDKPPVAGNFCTITTQEGMNNPEARRLYKFSVNGEVFNVGGNPDSTLGKELEKIIKNAIKD